MIKLVIFDLDNTLVDFSRMKRLATENAVDAMIDAKRALMLDGGYVPGMDHAIPPDISCG